MNFLSDNTPQERFNLINTLSKKFKERASLTDESGLFPFENIQDLKESGYTALTVPKEYGGKGISLYEMLKLQERIAEGDGSTALAIGWHMGIIKNLGEKKSWNNEKFTWLCEEVKKGALINSAASEPQTGSPTRGGKPQTTAQKENGHWIINGRKIFTTMSPVLDYFIVSASVVETGETGNFLIPRSAQGLEIEETWDSIAMRGTGSHDLILNNVTVPSDYFVEILTPGKKGANGWLLHIPACYLGIAEAAKKYAIEFAKEYSPNSIKGSIIDIPAVKQKTGEMELLSVQSSHFLYSAARQWDEATEVEKQTMGPLLGAVKLSVTNSAIEIVDIAMRIVGAKSLSIKNPLQRYYRDVRAGLHNPPMDDMTILSLAERAISSID